MWKGLGNQTTIFEWDDQAVHNELPALCVELMRVPVVECTAMRTIAEHAFAATHISVVFVPFIAEGGANLGGGGRNLLGTGS